MSDAANKADINDLKKDQAREGQLIRAGEEQARAPTQSSVSMVARGEFDAAIADARANPRSVERARKEMMDLCCLNEQTAKECLYAVSRDGKVIEGPSIRMAEIIAYCWRNYQVGSRIVAEGHDTVTVQGIYRDLERGGAIFSEVTRRILDKKGRRYSVDMIVTTTNAAQSVAKRNAITSGVPRALWWDVYQQARHVAAGDVKTLATKRADAIAAFQVYGVTKEQIFAKLGRAGEMEVTRDDLVLLYGIYTSIKDEELTPEEAFPPAPVTTTGSGAASGSGERAGGSASPGQDVPAPAASAGKAESAQPGGGTGSPAAPQPTQEGEAAARARMEQHGVSTGPASDAAPPQTAAPQGIASQDAGNPTTAEAPKRRGNRRGTAME